MSCRAVLIDGGGTIGAWLDLFWPWQIPGVKITEIGIVGESKCRDALRRAREAGSAPASDGSVAVAARAECVGSDRVRVASMTGETLGYLTGASAKRYWQPIAAVGGSFPCKGTLRGGDSATPSIAMFVDLGEPEAIP